MPKEPRVKISIKKKSNDSDAKRAKIDEVEKHHDHESDDAGPAKAAHTIVIGGQVDRIFTEEFIHEVFDKVFQETGDAALAVNAMIKAMEQSVHELEQIYSGQKQERAFILELKNLEHKLAAHVAQLEQEYDIAKMNSEEGFKERLHKLLSSAMDETAEPKAEVAGEVDAPPAGMYM